MPALLRLESELRELARVMVHEFGLPAVAPSRMWGGHGNGLPCALCAEVIPEHEVEYEVEALLAGQVQTFRFHFLCHAAWQLECARIQHESRGDRAKHADRGLPHANSKD